MIASGDKRPDSRIEIDFGAPAQHPLGERDSRP